MSRTALLCATALIACAFPAAAHRGSSTLSVVLIDAGTGAVTITHHMAAHDVEPVLSRIAPDAQPSVDDQEAMAALVRYAGRAFVVADDRGRVQLMHSETRLAGDDVRLVYTARLDPPGRSVTVDSNLFEESRPNQENQVNVRRAGITRTVLFRPGSEPQRVDFD